LIKKGEVDVLLSLEKLEAVRWLDYLRPDGIVIINNQAIPPLAVSLGYEKYPSDGEIIGILKQRTKHIYMVNGVTRARELGNPRTLNIFMLGAASGFLPLKVDAWQECIAKRLPPKIRQINITAFKQGRKELRGVSI